MKLDVPTWARKAFELIFHAEHHWRKGQDYDRRLALISFDNSIEVSIAVYLGLNPIQRGGRSYKKDDVSKWLFSYHTKLDFFAQELATRKLPEHRDKASIIWLHDQRNEIYHGSSSGVPENNTLEEIRQVAIWVYSVLFEDAGVEEKLTKLAQSIDEEQVSPTYPPVPSLEDISESISDPVKATVLLGASIAGKWDEKNPADLKILKRLADEL